MTFYPVHFNVERAPRFTRFQLLLRIAAFVVLGMVGLSFGSFFCIAYVGLPVFAAIRLSALDSSDAYCRQDGPRVIRGLYWFASVCAWAGLVAERLPAHQPGETVLLAIDDTSHAVTPGSALLRLLSGLPSALVLMLLGWIGIVVWLWTALSILFAEKVGPAAFDYLVGLQRWSVRLLAYQACLVDEYPPFSLSDTPGALPESSLNG